MPQQTGPRSRRQGEAKAGESSTAIGVPWFPVKVSLRMRLPGRGRSPSGLSLEDRGRGFLLHKKFRLFVKAIVSVSR
jgi:hypothetical protein